MSQKDNEKNSNNNEKKPLNDYLKYSSLAIQMGATIGIATWIGVMLDERFEYDKFPLFTLIFSLSAIFGTLYKLIRQLTREE